MQVADHFRGFAVEFKRILEEIRTQELLVRNEGLKACLAVDSARQIFELEFLTRGLSFGRSEQVSHLALLKPHVENMKAQEITSDNEGRLAVVGQVVPVPFFGLNEGRLKVFIRGLHFDQQVFADQTVGPLDVAASAMHGKLNSEVDFVLQAESFGEPFRAKSVSMLFFEIAESALFLCCIKNFSPSLRKALHPQFALFTSNVSFYRRIYRVNPWGGVNRDVSGIAF